MSIKNVYRFNFPETNSSSSHTCVIDLESNFLSLDSRIEEIKKGLDIREDILYIPKCNIKFGYNNFKTNNVLDKIHYLTKHIFLQHIDYDNPNKLWDFKKIYKFTQDLRMIFKVDDVKFEFVEEFSQYYKEHKKDFEEEKMSLGEIYELYLDLPIIEGSSSYKELIDMILEDFETLKRFLLLDRSWLIGETDCECMDTFDLNFVEEADFNSSRVVIVSIEFGGDIGRYDVEIPITYALGSYDERWYNNLLQDEFLSLLSCVIDSDGTVRVLISDYSKKLGYLKKASYDDDNDDTLKWKFIVYETSTNKYYLTFVNDFSLVSSSFKLECVDNILDFKQKVGESNFHMFEINFRSDYYNF